MPTEEEEKKRVMDSQKFQTWAESRSQMSNQPGNMYQAFRIDESLKARIKPKPFWSKQVNRSDMNDIDYPPGYGRRPEHPLKPSEKKATKEMRPELERRIKEFSDYYGVPEPELILTRHGSLDSKYHSGRVHYLTRKPIDKPSVEIGGDQGMSPKLLATLYHELGHHAHAYEEYRVTGKVSEDYIAGHRPGRRQKAQTTRIHDEQKAWKLAQPFLKEQRPIQKWQQRFALGTYRRNVGLMKKYKGNDPTPVLIDYSQMPKINYKID